MEKTKLPMKTTRFMVFFHLSFLAIGLIAIYLMIIGVIQFVLSALMVIALAISLNALFLFLWFREDTTRRIQEPQEPQLPQEPRPPPINGHFFPMVSLVVPVYNEEANLVSHIANLIKFASGYRGSSEIIIVDDGSTDNTFQYAWSIIDLEKTSVPNIRMTVLRHTSRLGRLEAIKSGVNKAMGEYIAIIDTSLSLGSLSLNKLVDSTYAAEEISVNLPQHLGIEDIKTAQSTVRLHRANLLRRLLNEELPMTA
jgi:hypothetical protein